MHNWLFFIKNNTNFQNPLYLVSWRVNTPSQNMKELRQKNRLRMQQMAILLPSPIFPSLPPPSLPYLPLPPPSLPYLPLPPSLLLPSPIFPSLLLPSPISPSPSPPSLPLSSPRLFSPSMTRDEWVPSQAARADLVGDCLDLSTTGPVSRKTTHLMAVQRNAAQCSVEDNKRRAEQSRLTQLSPLCPVSLPFPLHLPLSPYTARAPLVPTAVTPRAASTSEPYVARSAVRRVHLLRAHAWLKAPFLTHTYGIKSNGRMEKGHWLTNVTQTRTVKK